MTVATIHNTFGPFNTDDVTTEFPFTFNIVPNEESTVEVFKTDLATNLQVQLTFGVDYTVDINPSDGDSGGTVTIVDPTTGFRLDGLRILPETQLLDIQNQGPWLPEEHELEFDRVVMLIQQNSELFTRAVIVPPGFTPDDYFADAQQSAVIALAAQQAAETSATNAATSETNAAASAAAAAADAAAIAAAAAQISQNTTDIGTNATDISTINSTAVFSVSGTAGEISSTGGQNPVLALIATAVTPGSYTSADITVDVFGRLTAAASGAAGTTMFAVMVPATGTAGNKITLTQNFSAGGLGDAGNNQFKAPTGGAGDYKAVGCLNITNPGGSAITVELRKNAGVVDSILIPATSTVEWNFTAGMTLADTDTVTLHNAGPSFTASCDAKDTLSLERV